VATLECARVWRRCSSCVSSMPVGGGGIARQRGPCRFELPRVHGLVVALRLAQYQWLRPAT
jgi:hypothetical protein